MVALERWLDADRIYRSVRRRAFAHTNTDSDTNANSDAYAESDAADGVAEQHACSAGEPDRRQCGCCVDAVGF